MLTDPIPTESLQGRSSGVSEIIKTHSNVKIIDSP